MVRGIDGSRVHGSVLRGLANSRAPRPLGSKARGLDDSMVREFWARVPGSRIRTVRVLYEWRCKNSCQLFVHCINGNGFPTSANELQRVGKRSWVYRGVPWIANVPGVPRNEVTKRPQTQNRHRNFPSSWAVVHARFHCPKYTPPAQWVPSPMWHHSCVDHRLQRTTCKTLSGQHRVCCRILFCRECASVHAKHDPNNATHGLRMQIAKVAKFHNAD
jgi:hypothetical protein